MPGGCTASCWATCSRRGCRSRAARPTRKTTCRSCWSTSPRASCIPRPSSPTPCRWPTPRAATRSSRRSRRTAARSSSPPADAVLIQESLMASINPPRPLAIVTGASTGIGRELAQLAAQDGHDLVIAADQGPLEKAAAAPRPSGNVNVDAVQADLSTSSGIDQLMQAVGGRPVDLLIANAGHGLGHGFLDKPFAEARHVIDTNITGTLDLLHRVASAMRQRNQGRILITGSIAGLMPGSFQAAYNGTKAFIDSFSFALRNELKDTGIKVTCLMPGATETHFFDRADMLDTKVGSEEKAAAG